ncbi:MAG: hypothetical protein DRG59_00655 [Deltaproteobacteria bacterium]|nr:MAG: hypothetical protein DRG59_00655 [Deltaproteobacteria bacterium]
MKCIRILVLVVVALAMASSAVFSEEEAYSGPDDPRVIEAARTAVEQLGPTLGAISLDFCEPQELSASVVDILGLISYETAKDDILESEEPKSQEGTTVGLVGFEGLEVKGNSAAVKEALEDLGAKKVGKKIKISLLGDVLFDFDKYDIRQEAEKTLYKVADLVKNLDTREVVVEGHTDSKGSDEYNMKLSIKRADSVRSWLINKGGLTDTKIIAKGYGETKPVAPNTMPDGSDNPEGRAKNRRVEIYISAFE